MAFNDRPVDGLGEQGVNVLVTRMPPGTIEDQVFPVANAGHQLNTQQVSQAENGEGLSLSIGVQGIRLNLRIVIEQAVDDVDGFPYANRDEMTEQGNVV